MGVSQAKSPCWHNPGASAQWKNVWTTDVLPAAEFHLAEYSSLELMHAGKILVVLSQGKEKLFNPCLEASSCLLHLGADKPQFSNLPHPRECCWHLTPLPSQQSLRVLSGLPNIRTIELGMLVEGIVIQELP